MNTRNLVLHSTFVGMALLVSSSSGHSAVNTPALPEVGDLASKAAAARLLDQLPMWFEANDGQMDPRVRFVSRTSQHALFLTQTEAVLAIAGGALRISLPNGNDEPRIDGIDMLPSKSDYFIGNDPEAWRTGVPHYGRVCYRAVYPGIDLVYYGRGKQLEHDFVVAPGADPQAIRMKFDGADSLTVEEDGDLLLAVGDTELRLSRPVVYQQSPPDAGDGRVEVDGEFVLLGDNEVGFSLGEYDRNETLVIDPVLSYSTYLGGSQFDIATAVAVDAAGSMWVAGHTASTDYPVVGEPLQETPGSGLNIFVAKLDPFATGADALAYSAYLGGDDDEEVLGISLDSAGNVYLTGYTKSSDFPNTGLPFQDSRHGNQDAFVMKLWGGDVGANKLALSTYLGGGDIDAGYGIAADASGNVYVAGVTVSDDFPMAGGPMQESNRGGWEAFISKLSPEPVGEAALLYSTYLGGDSTDVITGLLLNEAGSIYVTGYTMSDNFPVTGAAYQSQYSGAGDVFLTRVDLTKPGLDALDYSTYLGGSDLDVARGISIDASGALYLAGYTLSTDFPVAGAAPQADNAGGVDIFIARVDTGLPAAESLTYSTYLGGSWTDVAYGVSVDSIGGILVAGYTDSADFPVTGDAYQLSFGGMYDAYFARLDPAQPADASLTCSSYFGGSGMDIAYGLAVDGLDNLYLAGFTLIGEFPVTEGAYQTERPGFLSAFVSKLGPCQ